MQDTRPKVRRVPWTWAHGEDTIHFVHILFSKHVSLNLTKYTLQSIIKLNKHIIWSAYFKILYFYACISQFEYFHFNSNSTKKSKKGKQIQKNIMIAHELLLCGVLLIEIV